MHRRDFLRQSGQGALWLSAAPGLSALATPAFAATTPDVAVVEGVPAQATRAAVQMLGGMGTVVKPGDRVVVKPNMSFTTPADMGANSHPEVVATVTALCWEAGAGSVLILDHTLASPQVCLERSGIAAAADSVRDGMTFAINEADLYRDTAIPEAKALKSIGVVKTALEADVLIAVPTAKSHSSAGVSLAMKGMMGLVNDRWVMHRRGLDHSIVDLASLLKADLSVIDANYVLTTGGPRGPGRVHHARQVIASRDMVAADAYTVQAYEWYGRKFQPRQVGHILRAHERGLGRMDLENLRVETLTL